MRISDADVSCYATWNVITWQTRSVNLREEIVLVTYNVKRCTIAS